MRPSFVFAFCWLLAFAPVLRAEPLQVVASFSILADISRQIGGERVAVVSLVGPDSDAHAYQPSPSDARRVARAQLLIVNGLGFEGWLDRLIRSAGFRGEVVVASRGVRTVAGRSHDHSHDHGHDHHPDPHAWQDLRNGAIYARNIATAMSRVDPAGKELYDQRRDEYLARIESLDTRLRAQIAELPETRRHVVSSHNAFAYLGSAYGLEFDAPAGLSSASQPSAAQVARLIRQIRRRAIPAVFLENISDPRLLQRIQQESGARIGGTLYSDALSGPQGDAPDYLRMVAHNLETLVAALRP